MDIVLIPGLWLDASSWDAVVPALWNANHRVHPLTLPGMESRDADRAKITLRDHIDAVVEVLDKLEGPAVLVGHSGGGAIAHGALDRRPDRVAQAIYVDSWPMGSGSLINDEFPAENGEIPLPDWSLFEDEDLVDLDDAARAEFRERAIPSPERVATDRQELFDDRRYDVPITLIVCEFPSSQVHEWIAQDHPALREVAKIREVSYIDLPTGHWPQFTRPEALGQAILDVVGPA
jgi:pimeloyl-ACP methyl ester carboxylesterase